ncbi:MAG: redoxin domain-containing protein [Planctomycetes bacterium]|nr:redoxin domain-containing protein [Planctomycetota bacterium]
MPGLAALLLALSLPAQGDADKPRSEFDTLVAEWKVANRSYRAVSKAVQNCSEYKAAVEAKDRNAVNALFAVLKRPDAAAFGARALKLADEQGADGGLQTLAYAAANFYDADTHKGIVERVVKDHVGSAGLDAVLFSGRLFPRTAGAAETKAMLEAVLENNKNAQPRAWAMYLLGQMIRGDKEADDETKARGVDLLAQAESLAAGTDLADRIAAPRFKQERLQIGMVAPEIEGTDPDGVAFKLSDYRGKVVVLDFWGFW